MPIIILFLAIAIIVSFAGSILNPNKDADNLPVESNKEEQIKQSSASGKETSYNKSSGKTSSSEKESQTSASSPIDTYIKYGPIKDDLIENTNKVVFEFDTVVSGTIKREDVYFETKIEGTDKDWVETTKTKRTVEFPGGVKEYTFLVRARTKNLVDSTPAERTIKINISPYFNKITITQVSPTDQTFKPSLIKLSASLGQSEKASITGWKVQGSAGSFLIPQGVNIYQQSAAGSIMVKDKDTIYISSATNPFGGSNNFRANKCMGYFNSSYDFPIAIQNYCPKPNEDELPSYLSNDCKDYISSIPSCQKLTTEGLGKYDLLKDSQCQDYINSRFSYSGCLTYHSKDSNFFQAQWHIYVNKQQREIMHITGDIIYLYDQNGLFVDKHCYRNKSCD